MQEHHPAAMEGDVPQHHPTLPTPMGIAAIELHLRKLQTYLQDLRGVQKDAASGTGDGKEKGGKSRPKKRFRMLQKKLFQINVLYNQYNENDQDDNCDLMHLYTDR